MSEFPVKQEETVGAVGPRPKDFRFWIVLFSLCMALFLSALELTAVSTALPTIVATLHGEDFSWVGSAYALASSAILPMTGGLAQIFGRRPSFLGSIALFAVGSAVCGAAQTMNMLISGRTVQGLGGGGILSFTIIVVGDMVTLEERGLYAGGFFGLTWSIAAAIGPLVGGSLANTGKWRWLFYLNLPLCGFSAILAIILLDLPTPPGSLREKLLRMDWIGNFLVIAATCSTTIALTLGGITFPWHSAHILSPLIVGILGLVVFIVYEATWAKYPLVGLVPFSGQAGVKFVLLNAFQVPLSILSNLTSASGYLQTFLLPVTSLAMIYYLPVYFQACKDADAISSGVRVLGLAAIAPAAIIGGVSVKLMKRYRPQIWMAWGLQVIGAALMTTVKANTHTSFTVGFCVLYGAGAGINYATSVFPVQAPLPITENAHALAFLSFMRAFAGVWGVTIGGAILQNELLRFLPPAFLASFPKGVAVVYSAIPQIRNLPPSLKDEVRDAFAKSLAVIWKVVAGVCGLGFVSSLFMKEIPLHTVNDEAWAPKTSARDVDVPSGDH